MSALSLSISAPLRPMMIPGRAVLMIRRSLLPGRSISTDETPAAFSFSRSSAFSLTSSTRSLSNPRSTNQRDFHGLLTPRRNPYGWTFCPIISSHSNPTSPRPRTSTHRVIKPRRSIRARGCVLPVPPNLLCCDCFLRRCLLLRCSCLLGSGLRACRRQSGCIRAVHLRSRVLFRNGYDDVREPALVAERTSHRGRADTLQARTFVGYGLLDVEVVDVKVETLLFAQVACVVNRRTQGLLHNGCNALPGEHHRGQGGFHAKTLDHIQNQLCLLRADALEARLGTELPRLPCSRLFGLLCHNVFLHASVIAEVNSMPSRLPGKPFTSTSPSSRPSPRGP